MIKITKEELDKARKELFYTNNQPFADNFTALVFRLITKAQSTPENKRRLMKGFPAEVYAWYEWQHRLHEIAYLYDIEGQDPVQKVLSRMKHYNCGEAICRFYFINEDNLPDCRHPETRPLNGVIRGYGFEEINCPYFKEKK